MIEFNINTCLFCSSTLGYINYCFYRCQNDKCEHNYRVGTMPSGGYRRVVYNISDHSFCYDFIDQKTMTVKSESDHILARSNYHWIATIDNYLQVIDRVKKLQAFQ